VAGQDLGGFEKVLRAGEGRRVKRLAGQAAYITSIEDDFRKLSDAELLGKTSEFRQRLENGEPLEELLFEAFAAVREARLRESDQRMFDAVDGRHRPPRGRHRRDEDRRGKTFVASLPLYLNALQGTGVHLVTVNDYLAKRDAEWNRGVFERLGMTVGAIENMLLSRIARRRTTATSPTARTPSSASTTYATTWRSPSSSASSAVTPSRSWTRSTRSSSTRPGRR
jgi:preprotein translocase subunit SecA